MRQPVRVSPQAQIHADLLRALPHLRAFAISLTGDIERADDLVQETIVRALGNLEKFAPGTNLHAWLFTILRNQFLTGWRKTRREVEDVDGAHAARLCVAPDQDERLEVEDLRAALAQLSPDQREAVLLVCAERYSYDEAAKICAVPVGTIKSRVCRARTRLVELMGEEAASDFGPSRPMQAVVVRQHIPLQASA